MFCWTCRLSYSWLLTRSGTSSWQEVLEFQFPETPGMVFTPLTYSLCTVFAQTPFPLQPFLNASWTVLCPLPSAMAGLKEDSVFWSTDRRSVSIVATAASLKMATNKKPSQPAWPMFQECSSPKYRVFMETDFTYLLVKRLESGDTSALFEEWLCTWLYGEDSRCSACALGGGIGREEHALRSVHGHF